MSKQDTEKVAREIKEAAEAVLYLADLGIRPPKALRERLRIACGLLPPKDPPKAKD